MALFTTAITSHLRRLTISNATRTAGTLPLVGVTQNSKAYRRFKNLFRKKATRRRAIATAIVGGNVMILAIVSAVILFSPSEGVADSSLAPAVGQATASPLDQVSSAAIAKEIAQLNNLPETVAVTNQADSELADLATAVTASSVAEKPAVISTAGFASNKDIKQYTSVAGDTVSSIAAKYGVTADSIRWSNNLTGETVGVNTKLFIPPVTGIVHRVVSGDTPASLAAKYRADQSKIVATNDAEISGLTVGELILIPDGSKVVTARLASTVSLGRGFSGSASFAGNGYIYGYCTWYVKNKRPDLPSNLGNARTWATRAAAMGLPTGSTAKVGAAVVTKTSGEGHVAYVEAVHSDGTVTISEMNRVGWNRTSTRTVPDTGFRYIY